MHRAFPRTSLGMAHEEMQRHKLSRLVRYAGAVLRRAGTGRPLARLLRNRRTRGKLRGQAPL